ncbi:MAG TPA: hypothetical protein VF725_09100 [Ktedonobacterales bacterium]
MIPGIGDVLQIVEFVGNMIAKRKDVTKQSAKAYFEQFATPTWTTFDAIHSSYKAAFKQYAAEYGHDTGNIKALAERMKQDWAYTADARASLQAMLASLPANKNEAQSEAVRHFIAAITDYFTAADECYNTDLGLKSAANADELTLPSPRAVTGAFLGAAIIPGPGAVLGGILGAVIDNVLHGRPEDVKASGINITTFFDGLIAKLQKQHEAVATAYYQMKAQLVAL